ncbi:bacterio-opsin activator domain-containing protein [Halalkalicoccus sp. NIPERK01]|uniref:helix-turn-helix domain-containing protein n=1 Tax=Halalkalicoccus sp. NIPERK01 TaxID=3053469 RepID=UPI00256ED5A4|nr:bacterio-opsin activator domain-containing protein [Halalkalicoccus sp. NIPERK01]MDL5363301.1 helix-turn-helix domain-containing protein [Halalkalicoccus sp. NIPERK01]
MTVIADITLPSSTFPVGDVLRSFPDARIELEGVVPVRETVMPLLWIEADDPEAIRSALGAHARIDRVDVVMTVDSETLFEVRWSPAGNELVDALGEADATVLDAYGLAESWDFRLRFATHEDLSRFNIALTEAGIPVTLRRIHHPPFSEVTTSLSSIQRDTLATAYRSGYFRVPRRISQAALAEELGISDSALSQRIRRGVEALVEQALISQEQSLR